MWLTPNTLFEFLLLSIPKQKGQLDFNFFSSAPNKHFIHVLQFLQLACTREFDREGHPKLLSAQELRNRWARQKLEADPFVFPNGVDNEVKSDPKLRWPWDEVISFYTLARALTDGSVWPEWKPVWESVSHTNMHVMSRHVT
jgi:hypothetical protein